MFEFSGKIKDDRQRLNIERDVRIKRNRGRLFTRPNYDRLKPFNKCNAAGLILNRAYADIKSFNGIDLRSRNTLPNERESIDVTLPDEEIPGANYEARVGFYPKQIKEDIPLIPEIMGYDPSIIVWVREHDPSTGIVMDWHLVGWMGFENIPDDNWSKIETVLADDEIFGEPYIMLYDSGTPTKVSIEDQRAGDFIRAINEAVYIRIVDETISFESIGNTALQETVAVMA
jgi:hypothetical protein